MQNKTSITYGCRGEEGTFLLSAREEKIKMQDDTGGRARPSSWRPSAVPPSFEIRKKKKRERGRGREKRERNKLKAEVKKVRYKDILNIYMWNMIISIYIYTLYTYTRDLLSVSIRTQHPPYPAKRKSIPLYVRPLSFPCNRDPILPSCLPPSLPPVESSWALPILQYLYFSMLKPRYIINYINKLRSPVVSRTNVSPLFFLQ